MPTRQAEGHALAGRCRRVGWPVRKVLDGWRVTCPDGTPVVIHLTPSDRNGHKATLRKLDEYGLAAAEQALDEKEEADRQAALAADREANERRTATVQARATALAKAAGPYSPAQVTIADILAEHPAPIVFGRVMVTPQMAAAILERNQPTVQAPWPMRPISRSEVAVHITRLRTGRFVYHHQGIALDVDGRLTDGQTRCTAIAESGIAGEMMVSAGWPRSNYAVVDSNRRRTAAHTLHHEGVTYTTATAAAVRLVYLYGVWKHAALGHSSERVDNDVIAEVWTKLDQDTLGWAVQEAQQLRRQIGRLGPAGPIAALYVIRNRVGDHPQIQMFTDGLVRGVEPDDDDPVYVLRRQLTHQASRVGRKLNAAELMALVVKGWNGYILGRRSKYLVVQAGAPMPSIAMPPTEEDAEA